MAAKQVRGTAAHDAGVATRRPVVQGANCRTRPASGVGLVSAAAGLKAAGRIAAARNDDMQWVFGIDGGPSPNVDEVMRSTGALLVGRRTQDVEDRLQRGFYGGAFSGRFFVLRHDPPREPPS
jgi:hypothetical protein